jgi:CheY-like chemotaxis protein
MARTRILVADDNPAFLRTLTTTLETEFEVLATATCGLCALEAIHRHKPDLVLLDLNLPRLNGIDIARDLAKHYANVPVVICSVETDSDVIEAAREVGVSAYVFKQRIAQDLMMAIKSALAARSSVRN